MRRASAIGAPTLGAAKTNVATGAGAPCAASGSQACIGVAPSLNARPTTTNPTTVASGSWSAPVSGI